MVRDAFEAVTDGARRRLLDLLREGEVPVNDLVDATGWAQPNVSKHLRVLRDAGLVRVRADGRRRLYSLTPEPLADIDAWLAPYRRLWSSRLDALERHLEENP